MSTKDRDRLKVLHEVRRRHITQVQAGKELGISSRWVRALLKRMKREGDRAVVHRLRGRNSNRKLPAEMQERAIALFGEHKLARQWHDYGPTLAAEELASDYQLQVSKETLRKWLIEAKLRQARDTPDVHLQELRGNLSRYRSLGGLRRLSGRVDRGCDLSTHSESRKDVIRLPQLRLNGSIDPN